MALAVLGGSFDPVHNGHVAMARHILDLGLAQKILVIPASTSPFKKGTTAPAEDRLIMTRLAFADCEGCEVDDQEIRRGGSSYMIETLEELKKEHPIRSLRLLIGADNVADFFSWHRAEDILSLAEILVLGRHGHQMKQPGKYSSSFIPAPGFDQRVSSSEIRAILAAGRPVDDLVPAAVLQHIRKYDLYS